MATITLSTGLGEQGKLTDFIDGDHLLPNPFIDGAANLYLLDVNSAHDGAGVILTANPLSNPFTYSGFTPVGGHVIAASFVDSGDHELIGVQGLDIDLAALSAAVTAHNILGVLNAVNGGNDHVNGSSLGDDLTIAPGAGNDTVNGLGGNDKINGGAGRDLLIGGAGADSLDGGAGVDTASYITSTLGVQVTLSGGAGVGGDAAGDRLVRIENLVGSSHADKLTGDGKSNTITGGVGRDTLVGGIGNDVLYGGAGDDSIIGGVGNDKLTGGAGFDHFVFHAGDGEDTIYGFAADSTDSLHAKQDHIVVASGTHFTGVTWIDPVTHVAGTELDLSDVNFVAMGKIFLENVAPGSISADDFALG